MNSQRGMILATTLIFLLVLLLLALTALTTSQLQLRMIHNWITDQQQFAAAEAGLRIGEEKLQNPGQGGCFIAIPLIKSYAMKPWLDQPSCQYTYSGIKGHYMIEELPGQVCVLADNVQSLQGNYYRVTAWVTTPEGYVATVLQSTAVAASVARCNNTVDHNTLLLPAGRRAWLEFN